MEQTIFGVSSHKEWKGDRLVNVCRPFDEFRRKREHKEARKCRRQPKAQRMQTRMMGQREYGVKTLSKPNNGQYNRVLVEHFICVSF